MNDYSALMMFPANLAVLFLGFPVALSLMSVALMFGLATFGPAVIYQFVEKVEDVSGNFVLAAVPLFVFMGSMLERSGIAERLFEAVHIWTKRLPGGLAIGTIIMCVIFAASTGVIGATETVVGLLAIPVMMKYSYNKGLISGTICAGSSLGTIIPPSVVVVVLGPVADVSVGDLFMGMVFPGMIMSTAYIVYILIRCTLRPEDGARIIDDEDELPLAEKLRITFSALLPPVLLIFAVLGSIMMGLAAPTEAAGVGAFGAIILTLFYRTFKVSILMEALTKTVKVTCMIMLTLLAGNMFSGVFIAAGGVALTNQLIESSELTRWGTLALFLGISFVAGLFWNGYRSY
ncbi:TRAP transporter large permease subunit [Rhodospirillales bacterium]|nr:TRAP transporter large permease subunit [Rhodospirillales bacterium]